MSRPHITPTGRAATFNEEEIIVSKTDLRGVITYTNDVFRRVSGYTERELIGQPHNIVRHPEMPRCVFKLLWDTLEAGQEVFAYIVNLAKNGDHYWVFAHVTPSVDAKGEIIGYHSNRRVPCDDALATIIPLYTELSAVERRHSNPREAMEASSAELHRKLSAQGLDYSQFVFSLSQSTSLEMSV